MNRRLIHLIFGAAFLWVFSLSISACTSKETSAPSTEPTSLSHPTDIETIDEASRQTQSTEIEKPDSPTAPLPDLFASARELMVAEQIEARGINDPAVLEAMRVTPRHKFVPERYLEQAYNDHPLPIGYGQTISQPYIVALMTEMLMVNKGDRVLEIGTGSGYQAAILAEMDIDVFTIEIVPELASQATERLRDLGFTQVQTLNADGYYGWEEYAPYDAIIVTAAPDHLPQPLITQLKDGGKLVIPIGPVGAVQTLWMFEKAGEEISATNLGAVTFVPLTGEH